MAVLINHGLLALAVAALALGATRVASALGARGLDRVLAAASFAAAVAVAEALALGVMSLGGSAAALALAAVAAWALARVLASPAGPTARDDLLGWLREAPGWALAGAGAAAGLWLAFTAWSLHVPGLGYDAVLYHVPEPVDWIHGGAPGSVEQVWVGLPVGSFPLTLEVLVSWGMGLSRSLVPVTLVGCAAIGLTALAAWTGLRRLAVPRPVAAAGAAALVAVPSVLTSLSNGWTTDAPALTWIAVCAALCAGALAQPALLVPAVVAGGLAIGTKTTAIPLALILLGVTLYARRATLRELARPLAGATALALVAGGPWYVRNLLDHGSPLWPYVTTPFGDAKPAVVQLGDVTFLDRPRGTFDSLHDYYRDTFAAGILLLGAGLLAPLALRTRAVLAAAVATALSVLLWMNAPGTGTVVPGLDAGTGDSTRYLLPALAAALLAVGLVARAGRVRAAGAVAALTVAALVGLLQAPDYADARLPSLLVPLAGAAGGAVAAWILARLARGRPGLVRSALPALAVAGLLLGSALAASGYVERHLATRPGFESGALRRLGADPRFRDGSEPVASTFSEVGPLAGDRLRHGLDLIPGREPCAALRARRRRGWVVMPVDRTWPRDAAAILRCLGASSARYRDADYVIWEPPGG